MPPLNQPPPLAGPDGVKQILCRPESAALKVNLLEKSEDWVAGL